MKRLIIVILSYFLFYSCASSYDINKERKIPFQITVSDNKGKPIAGAKIEYAVGYSVFRKYDQLAYTSESGNFSDIAKSNNVLDDISFRVSKDGYCPETGRISLIVEENIKPATVELEYIGLEQELKIVVKDVDKLPISDASITVTSIKPKLILSNNSYSTNEFGESYIPIGDLIKSLADPCKDVGELELQIEKMGYNNTKKNYKFYARMSNKVDIELNTLADYFTLGFLSNLNTQKLKSDISEFLVYLLLKSLLTESIIQYRSIDLIEFKKKFYLAIKFENINVYNSLKLSKYDIGKLLFDEVVRKVVDPLNTYLVNSEDIYGFDLIIIGNRQNFAEKDIPAETIEYRFLIPKEIIRLYKNQDIAGQKVLDESIILMDNERIELNLQ